MLVRAFKLFARSTRAEGFWRFTFRLFRCYNSKLTYCKNFRKIGWFLEHFAGNLKSAKKERKSNTPLKSRLLSIYNYMIFLCVCRICSSAPGIAGQLSDWMLRLSKQALPNNIRKLFIITYLHNNCFEECLTLSELTDATEGPNDGRTK